MPRFLPVHRLALCVAVAGLVIVMVWLITLLWLDNEKEAMWGQASQNLHNTVLSVKEHSVSSIETTDEILRLIQFHYKTGQSKEFDQILSYIDQKTIDTRFLNQVGAIDAEGTYVYSNLANHKKINLADREHFRVFENGYALPVFISKPLIGRASGKWSIQMTRRLDKKDGSFNGVAVISIDPKHFLRQYDKVQLGPDSLISLVGFDGYARSLRVGDTPRIDDMVNPLQLPEEVRQQDSGAFVSDDTYDHVRRLYAYERIPNQPFIALVGMAESAILAPLDHIREAAFAAAGAISALVALLAGGALYFLHRGQQAAAHLHSTQQALVQAHEQADREAARLATAQRGAAVGEMAVRLGKELETSLHGLRENLTQVEEGSHDFKRVMQLCSKFNQRLITSNEFEAEVASLNQAHRVEALSDGLEKTRKRLQEVALLVDLLNEQSPS